MRSPVFALIVSLVLSGCAAVSGQYGTKMDTDKFNNNQTTVMMTGGIIDADPLGMASNPAEFNPFVVRAQNNKIVSMGVYFSFENNVTLTHADWLNIKAGSKAIFLLNNGASRVELVATNGDIKFDVSAPGAMVNTTHFDHGVFSITPAQLKEIANASSVEVRVAGMSSSIDFPRKPNNHLFANFLPNWKKFYETEVQPFSN